MGRALDGFLALLAASLLLAGCGDAGPEVQTTYFVHPDDEPELAKVLVGAVEIGAAEGTR